MQRVVIYGATSRIAQEIGRLYAQENAELFLVGRGLEKLETIRGDLKSWGATSVWIQEFDFLKQDSYGLLVESIKKKMPVADVVLLAFGVLGQAEKSHSNPEDADLVLRTNLNAPAGLSLASRGLLEKGSSLVYLSSVAGDRARRSNFVYGTAKAGMNFFLDGYRLKLDDVGIKATTIKLGPVDTPMTAEMVKLPFLIAPDHAALKIKRAIEKGCSESYIPLV